MPSTGGVGLSVEKTFGRWGHLLDGLPLVDKVVASTMLVRYNKVIWGTVLVLDLKEKKINGSGSSAGEVAGPQGSTSVDRDIIKMVGDHFPVRPCTLE